MFLKNTVYFYFVLLTAVLLTACKKAPTYPAEPSISFKELRVVSFFTQPPGAIRAADSIYISINFKDGDGDLGNEPAGDFDFFIYLYKKTNGTYNLLSTFDPLYYSRLPLLSPYKAVGPIDGVITYKVEPYVKGLPLRDTSEALNRPPLFGQDDTLKFRIQIKDRANNYSNIVESTEYIVWKNL